VLFRGTSWAKLWSQLSEKGSENFSKEELQTPGGGDAGVFRKKWLEF